jgi:hemin uptake protein HemP
MMRINLNSSEFTGARECGQQFRTKRMLRFSKCTNNNGVNAQKLPGLNIDIESRYRYSSGVFGALSVFSPARLPAMMNQNPPPQPPAPNDPIRPRPNHEGPRRFASNDLFDGAREILIDHQGEIYRLSVTRSGKLILHK